jgi:AraC family transcriptional regulator
VHSRLPFGAFCGEVRRECRIAGFALTETAYFPGTKLPRHTHGSTFFGLTLQGAYTETDGRQELECGPEALVFHPEGDAHSDHIHDSICRIFSVSVPDGRAAELREAASLFDDRLALAGGPPVRLASRLYVEILEPDALTPLVAEGLILELLGLAARRERGTEGGVQPRWLLNLADLLRARFRENLSPRELARAAGVHPSHLARSFRSHHRCTVGEFVRRLRVDYACQGGQRRGRHRCPRGISRPHG